MAKTEETREDCMSQITGNVWWNDLVRKKKKEWVRRFKAH